MGLYMEKPSRQFKRRKYSFSPLYRSDRIMASSAGVSRPLRLCNEMRRLLRYNTTKELLWTEGAEYIVLL